MKKASPTTYKVGSIGEFAAWTKRVVCDPSRVADRPKQWYDSEATAQQTRADQVSAEAMVKLLSPDNLAVLDAISRHRPASVHELAGLTGRTEGSLSRTLKRFAQAGIVEFAEGPRRRRAPSVIATHVHLDIDLTGRNSAVVIQGRELEPLRMEGCARIYSERRTVHGLTGAVAAVAGGPGARRRRSTGWLVRFSICLVSSSGLWK